MRRDDFSLCSWCLLNKKRLLLTHARSWKLQNILIAFLWIVGYFSFTEIKNLSRDKFVNLILNVWSHCHSQSSSSSFNVRFSGWPADSEYGSHTQSYTCVGREGKEFSILIYSSSKCDSIRFKVLRYLFSFLSPKSSRNISRFLFATIFFYKFTFLLNARISSLEVVYFLWGLAVTCPVDSCDEKCLLSSLAFAVNVHLQSTLQNLAYWFLESINSIHLSAQSPWLERFLYSATRFPYVAIDICVLCPDFHSLLNFLESLFNKVDHFCNINKNYFQFIFKLFWNQHLSMKKTVCWDYIRILFYMRSKTFSGTNHWWSTISPDAKTIPPGERALISWYEDKILNTSITLLVSESFLEFHPHWQILQKLWHNIY